MSFMFLILFCLLIFISVFLRLFVLLLIVRFRKFSHCFQLIFYQVMPRDCRDLNILEFFTKQLHGNTSGKLIINSSNFSFPSFFSLIIEYLTFFISFHSLPFLFTFLLLLPFLLFLLQASRVA